MIEFKTKDDLLEAWAKERAHEYNETSYSENLKLARIESKMVASYVPHIYRGGWIIRGFGYSTERIGRFVCVDEAGSPFIAWL